MSDSIEVLNTRLYDAIHSESRSLEESAEELGRLRGGDDNLAKKLALTEIRKKMGNHRKVLGRIMRVLDDMEMSAHRKTFHKQNEMHGKLGLPETGRPVRHNAVVGSIKKDQNGSVEIIILEESFNMIPPKEGMVRMQISEAEIWKVVTTKGVWVASVREKP